MGNFCNVLANCPGLMYCRTALVTVVAITRTGYYIYLRIAQAHSCILQVMLMRPIILDTP